MLWDQRASQGEIASGGPAIGSRRGKALKAFKAFPASENLLHQDAGAHVNQLVRQLRGLVHGGVVIGGVHVNDVNDLMPVGAGHTPQLLALLLALRRHCGKESEARSFGRD